MITEESPHNPARVRRAELMLVLTTLIWGASFSIVKYLIDAGVAPMAVTAWRFGLATVLFVLLFARRVTALPARATLVHGLILGLLLHAGFALQTIGLGITSSSRSGFITALYVIFTPLLQIILTRRAPRPNVWLGITLVLLGLWGLTAPDGTLAGLIEPWRQGGFNPGDALTIGSALFFAIYIVLLDRYATGGEIVELTMIQLAVVAVCSTMHVGVESALQTTDGAVMIPAAIAPWAGIIYLSLLASVLATYWQTLYQRDTTPSRAAVIFTLESVFAAVIAAVFLGESLSPLAVAGGVLIVAGLLVTQVQFAQRASAR